MPDYLAQYTVYFSNDGQGKQIGKELLHKNPVLFFQGWDLKLDHQQRFPAETEAKAIGIADLYKRDIYLPEAQVITVTLDELLEVKPVNIKNEGIFKKINLDEACETIIRQNRKLEEYKTKGAKLNGVRSIDKDYTILLEEAEGYRWRFNETELAMISGRVTIKGTREK